MNCVCDKYEKKNKNKNKNNKNNSTIEKKIISNLILRNYKYI